MARLHRCAVWRVRCMPRPGQAHARSLGGAVDVLHHAQGPGRNAPIRARPRYPRLAGHDKPAGRHSSVAMGWCCRPPRRNRSLRRGFGSARGRALAILHRPDARRGIRRHPRYLAGDTPGRSRGRVRLGGRSADCLPDAPFRSFRERARRPLARLRPRRRSLPHPAARRFHAPRSKAAADPATGAGSKFRHPDAPSGSAPALAVRRGHRGGDRGSEATDRIVSASHSPSNHWIWRSL